MRRLEAKKKLSFVATEEEGDEGLASPARPKSSAVNVVDLRTPPKSSAREQPVARFISEGAARGCPGVARAEVTVVLADEKGQAGDSVRVFEPQEGRDAVPAGDCGPVHAPEMNEMNESTR